MNQSHCNADCYIIVSKFTLQSELFTKAFHNSLYMNWQLEHIAQSKAGFTKGDNVNRMTSFRNSDCTFSWFEVNQVPLHKSAIRFWVDELRKRKYFKLFFSLYFDDTNFQVLPNFHRVVSLVKIKSLFLYKKFYSINKVIKSWINK